MTAPGLSAACHARGVPGCCERRHDPEHHFAQSLKRTTQNETRGSRVAALRCFFGAQRRMTSTSGVRFFKLSVALSNATTAARRSRELQRWITARCRRMPYHNEPPGSARSAAGEQPLERPPTTGSPQRGALPSCAGHQRGMK